MAISQKRLILKVTESTICFDERYLVALVRRILEDETWTLVADVVIAQRTVDVTNA